MHVIFVFKRKNSYFTAKTVKIAKMNSLSELITTHRKIAGLTQLELAELAEVGKTVIFDLEHGKMTVRLDIVLRILHVLNIRVSLQSPLYDVLPFHLQLNP